MVCTTISSASAGAMDWLRSWHVEVSTGSFPQVTQPADPHRIITTDRWGNIIREDKVFVKPLSEPAFPTIGLKGQIPLFKIAGNAFGVYGEFQQPLHTVNATVQQNSYGIFLSRPMGVLSTNAWVGSTAYKHEIYNEILISGTASTTAIGIGARATVGHFTLDASVERVSDAATNKFKYVLAGSPVTLPSSYQAPARKFNANTTLRLGVGFNLTFLPSQADVDKVAAKRLEIIKQDTISRAVASGLPEEYQLFTLALAGDIIDKFGSSTLSLTAPGSINWDTTKNNLMVHVNSGKTYEREGEYSFWAGSNTVVEGLYKPFQTDFADPYLTMVKESINSSLHKGMQVPKQILLVMDYKTFQIGPSTTSTTKQVVAVDPVTKTPFYQFVTNTQPGAASGEEVHVAKQTLEVAGLPDISVRVTSTQTEISAH